jgi:hypothetical protein
VRYEAPRRHAVGTGIGWHRACDEELFRRGQRLPQLLEQLLVRGVVTEVLANLILMAPNDDQSKLMAAILANLGSFVLEKKEEADPINPRRPSHH